MQDDRFDAQLHIKARMADNKKAPMKAIMYRNEDEVFGKDVHILQTTLLVVPCCICKM